MEGVLAEEVGRTDVERGQTAMEMLRSSPVRLRHSHPRSLLGVVPLPLIQSLNFHQFRETSIFWDGPKPNREECNAV